MATKALIADLSQLQVSEPAVVTADSGEIAAKDKTGESNNPDDLDNFDDPDDDEADPNATAESATKKKRKRKPRRKNKTAVAPSSQIAPPGQSAPPRVLVSQLFPNRSYPHGEEVEYQDENRYRTTSAEKRHHDSLNEDFLTDYREAAEVHRQVRQWAQTKIKPGMALTEIAEGIEDAVRALVGHPGLEEGDGLVAGMGFPTGLSLNNCAAHYTPNAGNKVVLQQTDVLKVDFGVHVRGRIVDSAFTLAFEPRFDPLLLAVREATNAGVQAAGIDAYVGEIGAVIQEVMESFEVDVGAGPVPVRSIRNLSGHNILPYSIHGTKSVPIIRSPDKTRMEEGDVFAIETFGSTGNGIVREDGECSHYSLRSDAPKVALPTNSAKSLLSAINKNFGTLPFCRRYLDRIGQEKYLLGLHGLVSSGTVESYPPLCDKKGSYTAQFEHTLLLRPTVKEVISRGDDF